MIEVSKMDSEVVGALAEHQTACEYVAVFAALDMDLDRSRADVYLVLTEKELFVLTGQTSSVGKPGKKFKKEFRETDFRSYDASEIKDLAIEEYVSSARLICTYRGEDTVLAAMTKTALRDARIFVKYAAPKLEGKEEEIDEDDFRDDRFCPKCGRRYPDPDRKICPHCMEKSKLYRRLFVFAKDYRRHMALVLLALALTAAMAVAAPYVSTEFFYDRVLSQGDAWYGRIVTAALLVLLLKVGSMVVGSISGVISARVTAKVTYQLKKTIFSAIERLSMSFFSARQTGGLMNQINNDSNEIYWFFMDGAPYFIKNVVQIAAALVIMLIMNVPLALCAIVVVPLFALTIRALFRRMNSLHARTYRSSRALNSALSDALTGFRVVKAFSREKEETERFDRQSKRLARDSRSVTFFNNTAFPVATVIMYLSNIIVWGVGGWMAVTGSFGMTYGRLLAFIAYSNLLNEPMFMIVDMAYWFSGCTNGMQRLFEIADAEPDVREAAEPVQLGEMKGAVRFDNVVFSYEKGKKVIDGVSFEVGAGRSLGIVGKSGAGKSTLANLLMRLYDVDEGAISIDGVNVKELSFDELRRNVGIVSQETYLFVGTIRDNIRYACPEATDEDVVKAAKLAGAHDFIVKLPDGYDTMIGFGYKELSGGERQRVSIARAIL
ncbi:MAG: ABC transporter ATP-binding protein, partial [Clostridia bacterium]|nr:ABC transporter ATP-binding protein [Clostridia bacterium]